VDAGAVPAVSLSADSDAQPTAAQLWAEQRSWAPPLPSGPGQQVPTLDALHAEARELRVSGAKNLAYLASHALDEWPDAPAPTRVTTTIETPGPYNRMSLQSNVLGPGVLKRVPSPRPPRGLPPGKGVPGRDLAASSPHGYVRTPSYLPYAAGSPHILART
jgi:hypothetical protein